MRDFLHHLFVPRESNNHKGRILHHKSLLIILALLLVTEFFLIATEKKYTGVLGIAANISAQELLEITNQKRAESGLPPLQLSNELSNAATAKATDMFAKNYWAHTAPDGGTPWGFIRGAGYEYIYAGENLARGFTTSSDVVNAWMNSPGHRDNMLSANYKEVGFAIQNGVLTGDETVLVVEEFGSRAGSGSVATQAVTGVSVTPVPTVGSPSPTVVVIAQVPTSTPSPVSITPTPLPQANVVASFQSSPLINDDSLRKNISLAILGVLLLALVLDLILVSRRGIARAFLHNIDHVIFFAILLIAILFIGKSAIL